VETVVLLILSRKRHPQAPIGIMEEAKGPWKPGDRVRNIIQKRRESRGEGGGEDDHPAGTTTNPSNPTIASHGGLAAPVGQVDPPR